MHRHQDVSAANKLIGNVELRNRLPVAVLLDTCSTPVSQCVQSTTTKGETTASQRIALPSIRKSLTSPKLLILQHIERCELLRVDALQTENLDGGARETALRCLGGTLHEQNYGRGGDGLVDC